MNNTNPRRCIPEALGIFELDPWPSPLRWPQPEQLLQKPSDDPSSVTGRAVSATGIANTVIIGVRGVNRGPPRPSRISHGSGGSFDTHQDAATFTGKLPTASSTSEPHAEADLFFELDVHFTSPLGVVVCIPIS